MLRSENIELFENLSQIDYEEKHFDFHNDFDCMKILMLSGGLLVLLFKKLSNEGVVKMKFSNVIIKRMEFFNFNKVENLTIDNLYRGRIKKGDKLIEFENDAGYFYLEFDEGQKFEFWSSGLEIECN